MRLNNSYKQIFAISIPIMLGSAAQNIIVLTDNIFLYHRSMLEFASIGLIGVFYLIIASMGYGFSRGGQIIIARRYGEDNLEKVGKATMSLLYLQIIFAVLVFVFIQLFSPQFFSFFIDNKEIYEKCLDYIYPRSYGVFFSFIGLAFIGLYTGIARTNFIIWDTLLLVIVNLILNYCLIFGRYGFPELGIVGAAWASTIAEIIAFIAFIIYMIYDGSFQKFGFVKYLKPIGEDIWSMFKISFPIVLQAVLGIGSWFVFFSMIENLGQRPLEMSNLIRNVYLILSIPCWGFSAGINTLVSNFIGQNNRQGVMQITNRTAWLSFLVSMALTLPIILFPEYTLYPLFGSEDMSLMIESGNLFWVLCGIMAVFSVGGVYMNGLLGTGATMFGLYIQAAMVVLYLIAAYLIINVFSLSLEWAWSVEIFYWGMLLAIAVVYLRSKLWHKLTV